MGNFSHKGKLYTYDDDICMCQTADPETLILIKPYRFDCTIVPAGFIWNGASSPNTPLARFIAPKFYKNIKASCVHDFNCSRAKNMKERHEADKIYFLMKQFVEKDQEWKALLGYCGVVLGAKFGIGSNF